MPHSGRAAPPDKGIAGADDGAPHGHAMEDWRGACVEVHVQTQAWIQHHKRGCRRTVPKDHQSSSRRHSHGMSPKRNYSVSATPMGPNKTWAMPNLCHDSSTPSMRIYATMPVLLLCQIYATTQVLLLCRIYATTPVLLLCQIYATTRVLLLCRIYATMPVLA